MISAWAIRKFLLKRPRAELIRLTTASGVQDMKPGKTTPLAKLADSIFAVAPDTIQCLDNEGRLLRAMRTDDVETETGSDVPKPPTILANDPETARLTHVASLIAKSWEHATQIAFGKFVEFVERVDSRQESLEDRLAKTEAAYRRLMIDDLRAARNDAQDLVDELGDKVEGETGDWKDQMLQAWMQGQMQQQAQAQARAAARKAQQKSTNGNGNGKAKA
jgi:hypothetical protein